MARSRARKLADLTSAGNTFDDGVISAAEVTGLGTAATTAATDYATAGQGTLAASALQSGGGSVTGNVTFGGNVSVDGGTIKLDGNYPVGSNNVALGDAALDSNVSGGQNTAIGSDALTANTASNNTAVGFQALYANTAGGQNTAIGRLALDANTTANENTAVGNSALGANTTGASNSALGSGAMTSNTTGANNVAIGDSALYSNTTASQNTAVGYQAGYSNTTGTNNTNFGHLAGYTNTTGQRNAYIGQGAGYSMTTGSKNSILGSYNGNQGGLDIRTSSNNIVLSDGDGNVRAHCDSSGTWTGVGGGTTLVATITTSGAREVSVSSLDLSGYSQLFFFGYNVRGNDYYDYVHIRDSGDSTGGYNRIGQVQRADSNHRGYFGGVIDLNTGMGFASCSIVDSNGGTQRSDGTIVASGLDTGITTSTTSIVIGHTEGNSGNFQGGTVKLYGA